MIHPTTVGHDRPELQAAIEAFVAAGFAGMQMRVHDDQGEWVGSAGVRKLGDTARPPTDGRFWAGSVAKTFTATAVLQLVAEGKIALDAPVTDHLPDLGLDKRITVRMLLQHTSGLFNYTGEYYDDGTVAPGIPATGKEWVDNRLRTYRPQELVQLALSKPARFEPGTDWSYSNTNYTLAALLIEQVTGRSYGEQMDQRILQPLGLRDTVLAGDTTELPEPHAHGYYRYQDADQWKVVDVSRQNLSMLTAARWCDLDHPRPPHLLFHTPPWRASAGPASGRNAQTTRADRLRPRTVRTGPRPGRRRHHLPPQRRRPRRLWRPDVQHTRRP